MPQYRVKSSIHTWGYQGRDYQSGEIAEVPEAVASQIPQILEPVTLPVQAPTAKPVSKPAKEEPWSPTQEEMKASEPKDKKVK